MNTMDPNFEFEAFEGMEEAMSQEAAMPQEEAQDASFDEFEAAMRENLESYESSDMENNFMDERLREMEKKLPEWSLEPPYSLLK